MCTRIPKNTRFDIRCLVHNVKNAWKRFWHLSGIAVCVSFLYQFNDIQEPSCFLRHEKSTFAISFKLVRSASQRFHFPSVETTAETAKYRKQNTMSSYYFIACRFFLPSLKASRLDVILTRRSDIYAIDWKMSKCFFTFLWSVLAIRWFYRKIH